MKMSGSTSQQEVLEFAIRFEIEKYDLAPTIEHRVKALKRIAEAAENLRRWLEENEPLVYGGTTPKNDHPLTSDPRP